MPTPYPNNALATKTADSYSGQELHVCAVAVLPSTCGGDAASPCTFGAVTSLIFTMKADSTPKTLTLAFATFSGTTTISVTAASTDDTLDSGVVLSPASVSATATSLTLCATLPYDSDIVGRPQVLTMTAAMAGVALTDDTADTLQVQQRGDACITSCPEGDQGTCLMY
ncbi:MAG: hypothetical protein EOM68_30365 [Spirochaetia bacterium]|nr:hypothetical protein [Spirochaetia bacterium]